MNSRKLVLGISVGDLNGIGPEIILKTFEDSRMLDFCTPVIFASIKPLSFVSKHFNLNLYLHGLNDVTKPVAGKINVYNVWKETVNINFGEVDKTIGAYAIKSLVAATEALKKGDIDALVTAPINKHNVQSGTFKFPGHTDYLNQELEGNSLMLMVSDELKIGLLTDHVPVKNIVNTITTKRINEKVNTVLKTLEQDFKIVKPKIALLGINPHNGDNGVIGEEDDTIIKPAIEALKAEGKLVFGPYSADSFFGAKTYQKFDAVIAAYHDQGLIPFKTLAFGKGVNYTAGLNKIRTSPDHGTAYEIAGKGEANINSFKEAVFLALSIVQNRAEYQELTKNPLKKQLKKGTNKNCL